MGLIASTNVVAYNSAISACENGQEWQPALQLVTGMQCTNMQSDVVTLSSAICAFEEGGVRQMTLWLMADTWE